MTDNDDRFKTHIKEPRWQQVASIVIILGIVAVWLWFLLR
jgi:cytoskeletal protein RodZ